MDPMEASKVTKCQDERHDLCDDNLDEVLQLPIIGEQCWSPEINREGLELAVVYYYNEGDYTTNY